MDALFDNRNERHFFPPVNVPQVTIFEPAFPAGSAAARTFFSSQYSVVSQQVARTSATEVRGPYLVITSLALNVAQGPFCGCSTSLSTLVPNTNAKPKNKWKCRNAGGRALRYH